MDKSEHNIWSQHFTDFRTLLENLRNVDPVVNGGRRSYDSLTVTLLKEQAKRKQIRGYSKLNKAELIAALRKKRK